MGKRDTLKSVIATLSASEKRYLKLMGQVQPGDKSYLQLFDAIDKHGDSNARKINAKLNFSDKQLADNKRYLIQAIYKALRTIEEPEWKVPELLKSVIDINNLNERGLYDVSLALIEKTMEQANHFEKYTVIIALLNSKVTALIGLGRINELEQVSIDLKNVSNTNNEFMQFVAVGRAIQMHCAAATDTSKQQVQQLLKHPLMQKSPSDFSCTRSASYWFNNYQQAYYLLGEQDKLVETTRNMVDYYQKHPRYIDIDAASVILSQITLSQVEIIGKNYDAALKLLQGLMSYINNPPKYLSPISYSEVRFFILHTHAHLLLVTGKYKEAYQVNLEIYQTMSDRKLHERYNIVHNIALTLLHLGKTQEAYEKLEELLQMGDDIRSDLQMSVRPAIILAQLDMKNYQVVPYLIKSAKAWLKRKKISNKELSDFFHYTYAIAKAAPLQRHEAWDRFLEALKNGEMKNLNESLYTLEEWLISKKRT
ncbi:MAG: hypothetical protein RLZZ367_408 [Bacteroidota bacterium]|jgi:hypothetical protein